MEYVGVGEEGDVDGVTVPSNYFDADSSLGPSSSDRVHQCADESSSAWERLVATDMAVEFQSLATETEYIWAKDGESSKTNSENSDSDSLGAEGSENEFFEAAVHCAQAEDLTEQDLWQTCAKQLSTHLRDRPILPASWHSEAKSVREVNIALKLPLYSCPFTGCDLSCDDRCLFLKHFDGNANSAPHAALISSICDDGHPQAKHSDWVSLAVTLVEREQFLRTGMAVTRRSLRCLAQRFNDANIKALICFACGQVHSSMTGPEHLVSKNGRDSTVRVLNIVEQLQLRFMARSVFFLSAAMIRSVIAWRTAFGEWARRGASVSCLAVVHEGAHAVGHKEKAGTHRFVRVHRRYIF